MAGVVALSVLVAFSMVIWLGMPSADEPVGTVEGPLPVASTSSTEQSAITQEPPVSSRQPRPTPEQTSIAAAPPPFEQEPVLPERSWEPLATLAPPNEHWEALQGSVLHDLEPVALVGCADPTVVTNTADYRDAVRAQWTCVHESWVPVLSAQGWSTTEPAVEFYPGRGSKSECGYLEAPAFYCSAGNGTAYFGNEHYEMARVWDLSINEMVNHEYGHHLQKLAGITDLKQFVVGTDDIERRSELQATCWSAMMTVHNHAVTFDDDALIGWQQRLDTMLVDGVHGSRESLVYWGTRGLYAETLGDCNTWQVDSEHVG